MNMGENKFVIYRHLAMVNTYDDSRKLIKISTQDLQILQTQMSFLGTGTNFASGILSTLGVFYPAPDATYYFVTQETQETVINVCSIYSRSFFVKYRFAIVSYSFDCPILTPFIFLVGNFTSHAANIGAVNSASPPAA